jgi:cation diffusion facilitator CzcD-associated flavoprotein CzcO
LANIPGLDSLIRSTLFHLYERCKSIYMDGTRGFKAGSLLIYQLIKYINLVRNLTHLPFLFTATALFNWYRNKQLQGNAELYAKLTPKYPLGCNVPTISSFYYPTFLNPKVELVTSPITEIMNGKTICTKDGREYSPDVSIFNGFWMKKAYSCYLYLGT